MKILKLIDIAKEKEKETGIKIVRYEKWKKRKELWKLLKRNYRPRI